MALNNPQGEIDPRFSSPEARPASWADVRELLESALVYWLSTVRKDGRPHVTPLGGAWHDDRFYFCTGADEQKARNLQANQEVVVTSGCNTFSGLDVVIEGTATVFRDEQTLAALAATWERKYPGVFGFRVLDHAFFGAEGNIAVVYEVPPRKVLAFGKGEQFSQTRWRF
jgi:general stress protein 26